MANAWGLSFGGDTGAWGLSWGFGAAPPPPTPVVEAPPVGGGGFHPYLGRIRTRHQLLEKQRIRLEALEVIEEVARRQALRLELDEQKRFEELERELELRSVEWEARYLDLLNEEREVLIVEEIGTLLRRKINEEEEMLLILIAASL